MDREEKAKLPLQDEAEARDQWRGPEDAPDRPRGEADEADAARSDGDAAPDGRPGSGGPGAFPPPD